MVHAYIAGPLFNEGERWFDEQIEQVAASPDSRLFSRTAMVKKRKLMKR